MEYLKSIFITYNFEITFALLIACILLLFFNLLNRIKIASMVRKYNKLYKILQGTSGQSLENMLVKYLDDVNKVKTEVLETKEKCEDIESKVKFAVQKVGFIRYNAFNDMGSDLSFSIALLDESLNGFILTSIYGREDSNVYAKPIVNGESNYALSVEEIQALDRARKQASVLEY
ncbi:hypothetical protein CLPU_25c00050 [Gottschalkia purinilytica]|uniref:DUF4446 domain-containing protein n=1 Tax=Gottschalkia purinilytica TaxID=1503 RepID=A0A0L0W749_GOTPU|nr:DUF4446 family protein [Gottschalkia purinilytica]KNF07095.1 hypothetical protein CLPU_25c00050 [Gottschalkia purinilytica]